MDEVDHEPTTTAPTAHATVFFSRVFELLPAPIKNSCTHQSKGFLKIQKALDKLVTTRAKFNDADYYPRSVRIEFALKTSTKVAETAKFQSLVAASNNAALIYKEAQKTSMLATVDLELQYLKKKKQLFFFETLDALCELLSLDKGYAYTDADRNAMVILLANVDGTALGKYLHLTSKSMTA
jgi:hypothetical protein